MTFKSRCRPLSCAEVRAIDQRAAHEIGMPTALLMENAGRGAAELLRNFKPLCPRVLILCGPGNNGGDGGVMARHLDAWGFPVRVVWIAEPARLKGDAALQWSILEHSRVEQSAQPSATGIDACINEADVIVDALLGTGLTRPVAGPLRTAIEAINLANRSIISLDLPSGLDADTGMPQGVAVRALLTATFVAPKLGFAAPGARDYTGEVVVVDIGAPRILLEPYRVSR